MPAISTGEMLRQAVDTGSEIGRRVGTTMRAGELVDDETMTDVVTHRLSEDDTKDGFLLDGYPRNLDQAETLEKILRELQADLNAVLVLEVPEGELVRRALARAREDDKADVIRERLGVYRKKTEPLIDYYRQRGILRAVDGFQAVEKVTSVLLSELSEMGQR